MIVPSSNDNKTRKNVKKTLHHAEHNVHNYIIFYAERYCNILQVCNTIFFLLPNITQGTGVPRGILGVRGPRFGNHWSTGLTF